MPAESPDADFVSRLDVDADGADHVYRAETAIVSTLSLRAAEATNPNAIDAGTPRSGRLASERSATVSGGPEGRRRGGAYSGRRWCSRRGLRGVSRAPR
jgi:hypothetical protein